MAVSGVPITGSSGGLTVNGQSLNFELWEVTETAGDINATGFFSQGFHERKGGLRQAKIHAKGYWDGRKNPTASPPGIQAGTQLNGIQCILQGGSQYNFPSAIVTEVIGADNVADRVDFDFTAMSDGPYQYPGQQGFQAQLQAFAF